MRLKGEVVSGSGSGERFTRIPWFCGAVVRVGGFSPVPGTLNLRTADGGLLAQELLDRGVLLVPPVAGWCRSLLLPVELRPLAGGGGSSSAGGRRTGGCAGGGEEEQEAGDPAPCAALVVRPLVRGYPPGQVEVVAPVHLRTRYGLADGSWVELKTADR